MAKLVPGKEEFHETLRYFDKMIKKHGVDLQLNTEVSTEVIKKGNFDSVVVATGVLPREINLPDKSNGAVRILSYIDVLKHKQEVGKAVAVIGAGGIGYDISDFLTHPHDESSPQAPNGKNPEKVDEEAVNGFLRSWQIDKRMDNRGGLMGDPIKPTENDEATPRQVFLLQRRVRQAWGRVRQDYRLDPPHGLKEEASPRAE